MLRNIFIVILILNFFTSSVNAYIGPGVGGGAIIAILGVVVATIAGIFGLIWFPVKRLLKKRKEIKNQQQDKVD